jgi:excisionase family DNA binding protein
MQDLGIFETHKSNPDPLYSIKEAAQYLGVSRSKMYELAKSEKLLVVKMTSDMKIRKSVLDNYIKQCEQPCCWSVITSASKENSQ